MCRKYYNTGKYYSITYVLAAPSLISCHYVQLNTVSKKKALNIVKIIESKQRIGQIVLKSYYYGHIRWWVYCWWGGGGASSMCKVISHFYISWPKIILKQTNLKKVYLSVWIKTWLSLKNSCWWRSKNISSLMIVYLWETR